MWDSKKFLHSTERSKTQSANDRRQKKNHTKKLHELALLLPISLKINTKKLTKKDILVYILHYINFLQRSINVAKGLLKVYTADGEDAQRELGQNPAAHSTRHRHTTPSSSTKSHLWGLKPRTKKLIRTSGDRNEGRSWMMPSDVAENKVHCTISGCFCKTSALSEGSHPSSEAQRGADNIYFLTRTQHCHRQKPMHCDSRDQVNREFPDADPWFPTWTPVDSPEGSPLKKKETHLGYPQIDDWNAANHPEKILDLSPSLFSNLGQLLPGQLEDDNDFLNQALFEDVLFDPEILPLTCKPEKPRNTPPQTLEDPPDIKNKFYFSVSLDHCYLSPDDNKKTMSSSDSGDTNTESVWRKQEDAPVESKCLRSSSKDGDYTLSPTARREVKKEQGSRDPKKPKENKKECSSLVKKKCVNGFIMFCRMNRKHYIRACPGTSSTVATKELAQLWRMMTKQEQKPYRIKAHRYSRQHNRNVKQVDFSSDDNCSTLKPFYQLLAEKTQMIQKSSENPSEAPIPQK